MNELAKRDQVQIMAGRLNIEPEQMHNIIVNTVMPSKVCVTNEQFISFLAIANEYKLNPISKQIYAFPAKGGGIQPIVSIDGWLSIINSHPQFDGMEIEFSTSTVTVGSKEVPEFCKCKMYRKDHAKPTEVIEYMTECHRATEPWKMKPRRMLQHKATIQAARYTFGISGIIDEDEKEAYKDAGVFETEKDISPSKTLNKTMEKEPEKPFIDGEVEDLAGTYMSLMNDCTDLPKLQYVIAEAWKEFDVKDPLRVLLRQNFEENKARILGGNA